MFIGLLLSVKTGQWISGKVFSLNGKQYSAGHTEEFHSSKHEDKSSIPCTLDMSKSNNCWLLFIVSVITKPRIKHSVQFEHKSIDFTAVAIFKAFYLELMALPPLLRLGAGRVIRGWSVKHGGGLHFLILHFWGLRLLSTTLIFTGFLHFFYAETGRGQI